MFEATINVTLKKSVLDPQGQTVLHALDSLGFKEAQDVRVGKFFVLSVDSKNQAQAEERIRQMCEKLLVNTVIEEYHIASLQEKMRKA